VSCSAVPAVLLLALIQTVNRVVHLPRVLAQVTFDTLQAQVRCC
jgi:hypothetical protein